MVQDFLQYKSTTAQSSEVSQSSSVQYDSVPQPSAPLHTDHHDAEFHHHHTHAAHSHHEGGHHLLSVENFSVSFERYEANAPFFRAGRTQVSALHDLNLSVHAGELLAVVGASGSGKSVLANAILGLYEPNSRVEGTIWFDGEEQTAASLQALRGRGISLVPQGVSYLDPLMHVAAQVRGLPKGATKEEREADARRRLQKQQELFTAYGLSEAYGELYPHQLSGGMARRILLMCALMEEPRLIVADEPTPGLDFALAVQALGDLRTFANNGGGVLLITHDIELALAVADRVAIFNGGTVVEETSVEAFENPDRLCHPFSQALWYAMPSHDFLAAPAPGGEAQ